MFGTRDPGEFSVEINGTEFRFWSDLELTRGIDSVDVCSFSAPFEPESRKFRDTFRPKKYQDVSIKAGGEDLFRGTMIDIVPEVSGAAKTITVSCYSKCGVWGDCHMPAGSYPLEFNGFDLARIAKALGSPFGLSPSFGAAAGPKFERVALEPGETPLSFLAELAKQRGLVIGSDEDGNPLFWKSGSFGSPVAVLHGNKQPVLSVTPSSNGQEYFSEITGIAKAQNGRAGSKYTEGNSFLRGVVRPTSFELDDTEPADVPAAVQAKIGRMFAGAASYAVEVATIFDEGGFLWDRNRFVKLTAPDAMIYRETDFLIRSVTLRVGASKRAASLGLVLPGAFSGELPEYLPWEESGLF